MKGLITNLMIWTISCILKIVFNRLFYIFANLVLLIVSYQYHVLLLYLLMGIILAPFIAFIDYKHQKIKFERFLERKSEWYFYIPFFIFDILFWSFSVLAITGDIIFRSIDE